MQNIFNSIMATRPNSNRFNLSHDVKMSFKMGRLYPTCVLDVIPGDIFNISVENMLRFAPLVSPVMHDVNVKTYWFFVPNRLLWDNFEDFITGEDDSLVPPYIDTQGLYNTNEGTIADYLGIPPGIPSGIKWDAMPVAAYALIYDEWFRDENLSAETFTPLVDGDNSLDMNAIYNEIPFQRAWEHDYFTSCLPFAQKGTAVTLPLVEDTNVLVEMSGTNASTLTRKSSDGTVFVPGVQTTMKIQTDSFVFADGEDLMYDPNGTLSVNINESAVTINQLREAFRLQEFLELDARGGTRYTETVHAHFGVRTKDSRLNRPELIGSVGGKMVISEVLQTASSPEGTVGEPTPLGTMGGHGISVSGGTGLNYRATEHGWIIGLINVQPRTAYQQGLARKWSRETRLDYFWPKFAHLGEQEILNKELYVDHTTPEGTFGYLPRYTEYRYEPSRVAGEMRSTLSYWHMGRIFDSDPALNEAFIKSDPTSRIFAVEYEGGSEPEYAADQIFAHIFNNIHVSRLMPKYGTPTL
ncbi:major capsid protein [Microviridae sp.]|nr:major capsid protein [Microviridae sp.]